MKIETLDHLLGALPEYGICLQVGSEAISVGSMICSARTLAQQAKLPQGSRIALSGLSKVELIKAIVSFDGIVDAMLLLPAALDEGIKNLLIESAGCTHRLETGELTPKLILPTNPNKRSKVVQTSWLLATSGTTGTPKIIEHNLATLSLTVKCDLSRSSDFVWGLLYDPCRFAGIQVVLQALLSGSKLSIAVSNDLNAQINGLLRDKVNALSATPSMWRNFLMDGRIVDLPLRQITLGGEIADQVILTALKRYFPNARIVHIYASTEAGVAFAINDGLAGFPASWLDSKVGSVSLRVRGDGHLLIKPVLRPGGKEIISRIDVDGYLDTQDLVSIEDGRFFFLGRVSGAINVGGNKVSPEEIENCIREVEGVLDVRVFGKKSSMMGEIVAAEIIPVLEVEPKALRQRIHHHCRAEMKAWQIPSLVSFVSELKKNAAGKVERLS
jgi:acyl-coenzyme A synthetase/AMP-(fatty) acid ligase